MMRDNWSSLRTDNKLRQYSCTEKKLGKKQSKLQRKTSRHKTQKLKSPVANRKDFLHTFESTQEEGITVTELIQDVIINVRFS